MVWIFMCSNRDFVYRRLCWPYIYSSVIFADDLQTPPSWLEWILRLLSNQGTVTNKNHYILYKLSDLLETHTTYKEQFFSHQCLVMTCNHLSLLDFLRKRKLSWNESFISISNVFFFCSCLTHHLSALLLNRCRCWGGK